MKILFGEIGPAPDIYDRGAVAVPVMMNGYMDGEKLEACCVGHLIREEGKTNWEVSLGLSYYTIRQDIIKSKSLKELKKELERHFNTWKAQNKSRVKGPKR